MISLEINDDDFQHGLAKLLKNATKTRPMMRAIATEMTSITEDNFESESWGFNRWKPSERAANESGQTLQKLFATRALPAASHARKSGCSTACLV